MRSIQGIYLAPAYSYGNEIFYAVYWQSCYITHFLNLRLRTRRVCLRGVSIIEIGLSQISEIREPLIMMGGLDVSLPGNLENFNSLSSNEKCEFFLSRLSEGIEIISERYSEISSEDVEKDIDDFRKGGCVTRWVHKEKLLRWKKVRAKLCCNVDENRFEAALVLTQADTEVFRKVVFTCKPNERLFDYGLKDIKRNDNILSVTGGGAGNAHLGHGQIGRAHV